MGNRYTIARRYFAVTVALSLASGCDSLPLRDLWSIFGTKPDISMVSFEVQYAPSLMEATIQQGPLAVFAEVTGGDGASVNYFERVPIAFLCVNDEGRTLSRSARISPFASEIISSEQDPMPPDATSSSAIPLEAAPGRWLEAPRESESAKVSLSWADDCPDAAPTVRLLIESAPQAQHELESACGDEEFGNASTLDAALRDGLEAQPGKINLRERGEPLYASVETWSLSPVCQRVEPFAADVELDTLTLDLSEQGLVSFSP